MHSPDLAVIDDQRLKLISIGWLDPEHSFEKGAVDESFFARLMSLLVNPWQPFAAAGRHPCSFCRFSGGPGTVRYRPPRGGEMQVDVGAANVFVPGDGVLYMAPSSIAHYIDAHQYRPPDEFIAAVLACPDMRSIDYLRAIHAVGGMALTKPPV